MKRIFEKWWDDGNKVFGVYNYRDPWKRCGIKPMIKLHENGGRKKLGDKCFDITLIIGYTTISYTTFNL